MLLPGLLFLSAINRAIAAPTATALAARATAPGTSTVGFSSGAVGKSTGGQSVCVTGTISISITANNTKLLYTAPDDQAAVTESIVELLQVNSNFAARTDGGPQTVSGTYAIYSKLCFPSSASLASNVKTVQFLTHGATLDNTYWDIAPGYSYIDAATAAGYATFSYDQLGVGKSDHPDPIQVVQAAAQLQVAHTLVQLLRTTKIGNWAFKNVVGVGHSAGSTITQAITANYPAEFDAVILTGTSTNFASVPLTLAAFNFIIANKDPSGRFASLPSGYLTQQSSVGIQTSFYRYPNYDPNAFNQQVSNKQTNTLGVLLTLGRIVAPAPAFTGPVDVVLGENDLVFCGGDCTYPTDQAALYQPVFYPAAAAGSQHYLAPGAGHSIAAHKSAPQSFRQMIAFLQANGIY